MGVRAEPGGIQQDRAGDDPDDFRVVKGAKPRMRYRKAFAQYRLDDPGIELLADESLSRPDRFNIHGANTTPDQRLAPSAGRPPGGARGALHL